MILKPFVSHWGFHLAQTVQDEQLQPYAYLLAQRLDEGHICVDLSRESLQQFYDALEEDVKSQLPPFSPITGIESWWLSRSENSIKPFVLWKDLLYMGRYFKYESQIMLALSKMQQRYAAELQEQKSAFSKLEEVAAHTRDTDLEGTDWQYEAAVKTFHAPFSIICGGPGTGKTTTVAKVLRLLFAQQPDLKVALAAPTGKAAMRMVEALKNNPLYISHLQELYPDVSGSTIHRLLGYIHNSPHFKHHSERPLPFDVVVVDEASMLDMPLFAKLLNAIGPHTRLILLGDRNQLPAVDAGAVFGDLCGLQELETYKPFISNLYFSRRFDANSGIGKLSAGILQGADEVLEEFQQNTSDDVFIDVHHKAQLFEQMALKYASFIQEEDLVKALEKLNHVRFLCAVKEGDFGVYQVNAKIEKILQDKKLLHPNGVFYHNRPIMVTKNDAELGLFNGDVGLIRRDAEGVFQAYFLDGENQIRVYLPAFITAYETVFAMTIHKSQGSEFDEVCIVLPEAGNHVMMSKELLYTAVTRAKKRLLIQAEKEVIKQTIMHSIEKTSGIQQRIKSAL
ncbi:MAG: exodeoxyribonuclease V subunit alpha [Flavobacterium sp.]|nr:exodeoxyribonuclease V subunit alpha [Candidatus Neoflavobacterium equi]